MRDDQPVWLVRNWRGTATGMSESELEQTSGAAGWGDEALDASYRRRIPGWRVQPTFLKTQTKRGFP